MMVTAIVSTSRGMATLSEAKKLKTFFAGVMINFMIIITVRLMLRCYRDFEDVY